MNEWGGRESDGSRTAFFLFTLKALATQADPVMLKTFDNHCRWLALLAIALCPSLLYGQTKRSLPKNVNYLLSADQPPGYVASAQVARGMPGVGTYQPVSIAGPKGLTVALARDGMLLDNIDAPVTTAMMVGATYRFRIANIPYRPGAELYPTVEIIDRICAPAGREHRFPIPVVLTEEDIELALRGALVTRVIYVEDSEVATPTAVRAGEMLVQDVGPADNALMTADQYGRPVAILRIGSRLPSSNPEELPAFLFGSPPWLPLITAPTREQLQRDGGWPNTAPVVAAEEIFSERPEGPTPRIDDGLVPGSIQ